MACRHASKSANRHERSAAVSAATRRRASCLVLMQWQTLINRLRGGLA